MAKRKKETRRASSVVVGEVVEVRTPGKRKRSVKRPVGFKSKSQHEPASVSLRIRAAGPNGLPNGFIAWSVCLRPMFRSRDSGWARPSSLRDKSSTPDRK